MKSHRLCVSLNSRLESNKKKKAPSLSGPPRKLTLVSLTFTVKLTFEMLTFDRDVDFWQVRFERIGFEFERPTQDDLWNHNFARLKVVASGAYPIFALKTPDFACQNPESEIRPTQDDLWNHSFARLKVALLSRGVDIRLPRKGDSNSHGVRPVYLIILMMKWIRTSWLSTRFEFERPTQDDLWNHSFARLKV